MLNRYLFENILWNARKVGAIFADIFIEDKHKYRGKVHNLETKKVIYAAETGVGIRLIFEDGRNINIMTNDLTKENLRVIGKEILNLSGNISGKFKKGTPESVHLLDKNQKWLKKFEQFRRVNHNVIDKKISEMTKIYNFEERKIIIMNSEGIYLEDIQARHDFEIGLIIRDEKGSPYRDTEFLSIAGDYELKEEKIKQMIKSVHETLEYKMRPKEERDVKNLPTVVNKGEGGIIMHEACGHAFELDNIKNGSFVSKLAGEKIGAEQISLIDDPTLASLAGSYSIDDEGQKGRKKLLINSGIILPSSHLSNLGNVGYNLDLGTGNGRRSSYEQNPLSRMSNFYLENGKYSPEEIIKQVSYGLFIKKIGGGQANPISGDFSYNVKEAYIIEKGQVAGPVEPGAIVQKTSGLLKNIEMIGDDLEFKSLNCLKQGQLISCSAGTPTLLIDGWRCE